MRFSTILSLAAAAGAYALPAVNDMAVEAEYDVLISPAHDISKVLANIARKTDDEKLKKTYSNKQFRGFSGTFTKAEALALKKIAGVKAVDPVFEIELAATRSQTPWGLQRISQTETVEGADPSATTYTYTYDETLGEGVDIYIIDTGILVDHEQFGGRASMGFSAYDSNTDDNGHGTHVSGTSAGETVGVASKANLIGVKVLSASGSGQSSDLISGIDYVVNQHEERSSAGDFVASVGSMSLGFQTRATTVETALKELSNAGIHLAVASGNSGTDTCTMTPGSLGGNNTDIISVGASNIDDEVAYFSNSGPCTDVYAPGVATYSSYNAGTSAYEVLDGTSMATPHVSGLLAYYAALNPGASTTELKQTIVGNAVTGKLTAGEADVVPGGALIIAQNDQAAGSKRFARRIAGQW